MFAPRYFAPRFFAPRYFPPGAEVVAEQIEARTAGGVDERRNVIIDGIRYRVTRYEEIQLLQAWIDRLNDEQKELQAETKKERKKLKTLKAKPVKKKKGTVKKETTRVRIVRRNLSALLLAAKELQQKRVELIERRQDLQDRLDEEDILSILMTRRLF